MLERELQTAIKVARRAGILVMNYYRDGFEIEEKFGADNLSEPVTIADRRASELIVAELEKLFPGDAILSEEKTDTPDLRRASRRVWMIDPIDGTQGFINKDGDFAIQIGLTENGEVICGVVFLPFHNRLYYAVKNAGAFSVTEDGAPNSLSVSDKIDFRQMTLAVSRNHRSPKMKRLVDDFQFGSESRRGSVGLKVGLIAEQICDVYIHLSPRTKFWDTCAPQIILEEAGGEMTDIFGAPLRYDLRDVQNHNGILATNGAAHERAVEKLKPLLNQFGRLRIKPKSNAF